MYAYDVTVKGHTGEVLNVLIVSKTEIVNMEDAVFNWMSCQFDFLSEGPQFNITNINTLEDRFVYLGEIAGINAKYSELGEAT